MVEMDHCCRYFSTLSTLWLHFVRQLVFLWVIQGWMFLFTRTMQVRWYWIELFHPSTLHVVSNMWPIIFGSVRKSLSTGSIFWKLIQFNSLGNCLWIFCWKLSLNICVRRLWLVNFSYQYNPSSKGGVDIEFLMGY